MGGPVEGDAGGDALQPGAAFLREPHPTLYPCVFDGTRVKSFARERLLGHAIPVFEAARPGVRPYLRFTLIGSGASYNWDEVGDLDIQVWTDHERYAADTAEDAEALVKTLRLAINEVNYPTCADLGLATSDCDGVMRVQFYVKRGRGTREDNLAQQPYACFDLDEDEWVVEPRPITPEFYAERFLAVEQKAEAIAEQADDLLNDLDRSLRTASYWDTLGRETGDEGHVRERDEARRDAEAAHAGITALFDHVFSARGEAYAPGGAGISDERDSLTKLLEVYGTFWKLKEAARTPLPWSETQAP